MKHYFLYIFGTIVILFFSCKKSDTSVNFHYDYFPLTKGTFIEYNVIQIKHDNKASIHDTLIYRLKTVVGDTFIDNQGRISRKFHRYIFDTLTKKYNVKDLWTVIIDKQRIELVEENRRIIKLVFSPTKYKSWNKNAFNDLGEVSILYEEIHRPYTLNNLFFDSTITVKENLEPNAFHYYNNYEVYAKNVGLIKKHYQDYSINFNDFSNPIYGDELFYEAINFGKE